MNAARKPRLPAALPPAPSAESLQGEIAMLREVMRRANRRLEEIDGLDDLLRLMENLGKAATRLAGLLKAERQLGGHEDLTQSLHHALAEVIRELGGEEAA